MFPRVNKYQSCWKDEPHPHESYSKPITTLIKGHLEEHNSKTLKHHHFFPKRGYDNNCYFTFCRLQGTRHAKHIC